MLRMNAVNAVDHQSMQHMLTEGAVDWHRPMVLMILATLSLAMQKIQGRTQWPMLSFNNLVTALAHLLPRRQLTAEDLAAIIIKRHHLRQADSHTRRAAAALE
ncbi:MAG: hypothetical protein KA204_10695 [Chromatiaceae bacterium]|nr:hypothetical protein [Chromatiaceae bacterium]